MRIQKLSKAAGVGLAFGVALCATAAPGYAGVPAQTKGGKLTVTAEDVGPVQPGKTSRLQWRLRNSGDETITRATLTLKLPRHATFASKVKDCTGEGTRELVCKSTTAFPPGATVQWNSPGISPVLVKVAADAPAGTTLGDGSFRVVGNGGVTDTARFAVRSAGEQSGGYDWEAVGTSAEGARGETVDVKVTVRNNGPAGAKGVVTVTAPAGTEIVGVPKGCTVSQDKRASVCDGGDAVVPVGGKAEGVFRLKITGSVTKSGTVAVKGKGGKDTNPRNNVAPLKITVTGGGGGGDELPVTGASVGIVAGLGAALLLAGGVLLVLGRRRRLAHSRSN